MTGKVLLLSGFGMVMGSLMIVPIVRNEKPLDISNPVVIGVALGGLVSELIGAFIILPSGYKSLFNGVNLFNRHKIEEYNK